MLLSNDIVKLRALEPEDLERLYAWENDPALWLASNTLKPYSRYELKQYLENASNDIYEQKQLRLMIDDATTATTVGTVDLFDYDIFNQRIALGLFIDNRHKGKGYAKAALQVVEEYVFNFLNIEQLYVQIAADNEASIGMFEKSSFEKNAILKKWIRKNENFVDLVVFQKFKNN